MRREDRVPYAQAVWASFQSRAGTGRDMASSEFMVVSRWMDRSLPLPVVLRAIHEFEGTPRRLEACEAAVKRAEAYWFRALGGL